MKKLTDGQKIFIVAATAILVNVGESVLVPNFIEQPLDRNWRFRWPSLRVFAQTMLILSITAFMGGLLATATMNYLGSREEELLATEGGAGGNAAANFLHQIR